VDWTATPGVVKDYYMIMCHTRLATKNHSAVEGQHQFTKLPEREAQTIGEADFKNNPK
jgi:hypothetical protein